MMIGMVVKVIVKVLYWPTINDNNNDICHDTTVVEVKGQNPGTASLLIHILGAEFYFRAELSEARAAEAAMREELGTANSTVAFLERVWAVWLWPMELWPMSSARQFDYGLLPRTHACAPRQRACEGACLRSCVPALLRACVPACLRSCVPVFIVRVKIDDQQPPSRPKLSSNPPPPPLGTAHCSLFFDHARRSKR